MANVSQLQPALTPQVQTNSSEALEKDADFLALRLVNKRARLRLSPGPLDVTSLPGKATLFAVVNSRGWFAAVTQDSGASALVLSPLADLRSALVSAPTDDEQSFKPQRRVPISGASPHILTFACNDTRALLGLVDGSIHVYTSDQLFSSGEGPVQPIHVFTTSSSATLLSIQPNPGDIPELIAVLRDCTNSPGSTVVELLDVQTLISSGGWMAGKSPSTTPTSISWSPKGKQLALGLQSGDIVTFSPTVTATPKSCIPHPPSANNMSVISIHWLSTTSFHTIYSPPGKLNPDAEQIHFHSSLDSKNNSAQDIRFSNPYLPFPGLRPPGEFLVCLRSWDPSKVLLFIGDSTSSDIGLIGSTTDDSGESWHNLSLEETSTPSLPLDKDQNDTILLGMDVDLTSNESYHHSTASGETLELPAHPIMFVYASDGTILGWHVLNVTGATYPGMVMAMSAAKSAPSMERESSSDMQATPTVSPTVSTQMETSASKLPSAVFGQPSPFSTQNSTFGTSGPVFSRPPTFGQTQSEVTQPTPVFGKPSLLSQPATAPVFGSTTTPSLFGQSSTHAFSSATPSSGFGGFSSTGPAKFGLTAFGFGGPPRTTASAQLPSASVPEESMTDDAPSFNRLDLGAADSQGSDSKPSVFGAPNTLVPSAPQTTTGDLIKPGTGFGVFGGFDQKSPFAKPSAFTPGFSGPASGPSAGTFSNLQTTPSSFVKPASGFFGELPKESPFFAPPKSVESKPVSAFALSATPNSMPPKTNPAQPTFGASSMPGGGFKNAFVSASATPAQPPPAPSSGAFSTFSGSGGFAAFSSGGAKSFSDLLRGGGEDKPQGPGPSENTPTKPAQLAPQSPVPTIPVSTLAQEPPKSFSGDHGGLAALSAGGNKSFSDLLRAGGDKPFELTPSEETPAKPAQPPPPVSTTPIPMAASETPMPFSTSGGGFAAFAAGGSKSFSDLLRTSREDKPLGPVPSEDTPTKPAQVTPPVSTILISTTANEALKTISSNGGLSAFLEGGNKSFSDPLGTTGENKSSDLVPSGETPAKPAQPSMQPPVSITPILRPATEPPKTFSTDGNAGGGFLGFSPGGIKSFSDLFRTTGENKSPEPVPSGETLTKPAQPPVQPPVLATPIPRPATEPPKPFSGIGGGFLTFSPGGTKSFNDLRMAGEDKSLGPLPQPPISVTPLSAFAKEPPKLFSSGGSAFTAFSLGATATRPAQLPPSPAPSATPIPTPARELGKPSSTSPAVPKTEKEKPEIVEIKASELPVGTGGEEEEGEVGEEEEQDGESLSDVPSGSEFEEEEEEEEEVLSGAVDEEEREPLEKWPTPPPAPIPKPLPTPEQGMQAECTLLLTTLMKEMDSLQQLALITSLKMAKLQRTSGVAHQKADLGDSRKWAFGDIAEHGRLLLDVQVDVKALKSEPASLRKLLKEPDSNMLKINTRKEEIARFNKAKTDAELTRTLKIRALAPEYAETQLQLRRSIRAIKDRVQKLEDHLQASKKRINELRTGRPSLRPPSLDTVNRTFRNIDISIEQQKEEISQLRHRMARLEVSGIGAREQLAVSSPKRPLIVTPNVAITTAAALNAERSAQKLKKALLACRAQPLLNTTAVVKAPVVDTPRVEAPKAIIAPVPSTPMLSLPPSLPAWMPPPPSELGNAAIHDLSLSRNRFGIKHHQKPITLKKNASPAGPTAQPPLFQWEPVEPIKPASSLPFAIRPTGSS